MSRRDDGITLRQMLDHARAAVEIIACRTIDDVTSDELRFRALEQALAMTGEAAAHLSGQSKETYDDIPWQQLIEIRDHIRHEYDSINVDAVWMVAQRLPTLIGQLERILANDLPVRMTAHAASTDNAKQGSAPTRVRIQVPQEEIVAFCRRHRIRSLALFGSVLRDDFTDESDVDVLVEFEPDVTLGWGFFDLQDELSEILGRRVDLNTVEWLSPYIRDDVVREAQVQYVAA